MTGKAQLYITPSKGRNLGSPSGDTGNPSLSQLYVLWREAGKENGSIPQSFQESKLTQKVQKADQEL